MVRKTARRDVVFLKTANICAIPKGSSVNFNFCRTGAVAATKGAMVASNSVGDILKGNKVSSVSVESDIAGRLRCQEWQPFPPVLAMKLMIIALQ